MDASKSKLSICLVSLLIIVLLSACSPTTDNNTQGVYPVDSTFLDFYREFGGNSFLGPAISPSFIKEGVTYQYVVAGLMAYAPNAEPLTRFHFSSIASVQWKINGAIEPAPADSSTPYINSHRIWEEIKTFYSQFGTDIIGLPLTGVVANDGKQRYEQYYEGLGFYRKYSDAPGKLHLMPYGSWMCSTNCQYQQSDSTPPTASYIRDYSATEQLFLQTSERLGYGFSGEPLSAPSLGKDGFYEMIFQNVIMYLNTSDGNQVQLRPLPAWLGIQNNPPRQESSADWLTFYPTSNGLGYNIPKSFVDYINTHGGFSYAGDPITDYHTLDDGGYSQCFKYICLEYHPTAPAELQIRPHALGLEYKENGAIIGTPETSVSGALQLNVWEQMPLIASGKKQTINIEARQNDVPVSGVGFSLIVKQPDGITKTYQSDPTGEDGRTSVELDPIDGPNGAIVQYQVCVVGATTAQVCFSRTYTIWDQ